MRTACALCEAPIPARWLATADMNERQLCGRACLRRFLRRAKPERLRSMEQLRRDDRDAAIVRMYLSHAELAAMFGLSRPQVTGVLARARRAA